MPTGYTAAVQDGEITEFSEFAMRCARAFGAYIGERDTPINEDVPDEFKVDEYYFKNIDETKEELEAFRSMTDEELETLWNEEHEKRLNRHFEMKRKKQKEEARYKNMLHKVLNWEPPTKKHINLKDFMIDQLQTSIDHDCNYYITKEPPTQMSFEEWKELKLDILQGNFKGAQTRFQEEAKRIEDRNQWIKDLKESL